MQRGLAKGFAKGEAKGFARGEAKGLAEGEAKGLAEGKAEGEAIRSRLKAELDAQKAEIADLQRRLAEKR